MAKKKKIKDKKEHRQRGRELAPLRSFLMGLGVGPFFLSKRVPKKGPHTERIII